MRLGHTGSAGSDVTLHPRNVIKEFAGNPGGRSHRDSTYKVRSNVMKARRFGQRVSQRIKSYRSKVSRKRESLVIAD